VNKKSRILIVTCVVALLAASLPVHAGINSWTIKGPPGGTFRDIAAHTSDPNILYAAYTRSFFRSTDGGNNWSAARHFVGEVVDIAVDRSNGNRLFIAVYNEGLFRSEDAGQSFTAVAPASPPIVSIGISSDGKTVYYSTGSTTFFRSTDGGQTWTERIAIPNAISLLLVDPNNADHIYGVRGGSVVRSIDGGGTWTTAAVKPGDPFNSIYDLAQVSATTLVVATFDGLYVSTDSGATWNRRFAGQSFSVIADPQSPGTLLATSVSFLPLPLLRSTDFGATWTYFGTSPGAVRRLLLRPQAPQLVVASGQGVKRSDLTASSWVEANASPVAPGLSKMATTIANNSRVYAYTSSDAIGLFSTSLDSGWQRIDLSSVELTIGYSSGVLAVKPGAPQSIYIGAFDRGVVKSQDGGKTWGLSSGLANVGTHALAFDPVDTNIMYAAVMKVSTLPLPASLYRSSDSGNTWAPHSLDLPNIFAQRIAVDPANRSRIFIAGYQGSFPPGIGGLYRSTNGGLNWSQVAFAGADVFDIDIDPSNSNRVYAGTALGLYVSTDGGTTFSRNTPVAIISTLPISAVEIDPTVPSTIYAANYDPGNFNSEQGPSSILRSVDSGASWEVLRSASEQPRWIANDLVLDPNNPSLIYVNTGTRGVAAFEIANDLAVSISGHSGVRPQGVPSSFDVRVQNTGLYAATSVSLTTALPAGLTGVSASINQGTCAVNSTVVTCNIPVLRAAAIATARITYTPPSVMALPTSVTATAHEKDPIGSNNSALATASVGEVVDLAAVATVSTPSIVRGTGFNISVNVSNAGPIAASTATLMLVPGTGISLAAPPAGCTPDSSGVSCAISQLEAGGSRTFTFAATATTEGQLTATATVAPAASATDTSDANNRSSITVTSTAPPQPVDPGGGGGGGGGALGQLFSLLLAGLLALRGAMRGGARSRRVPPGILANPH
jgi:uncharacterized repeat protein (TIGR01451 family)